MKKTLLFAAIACVICAPIYASDDGMADFEPKITVTTNDFARPVAKPAPKAPCGKCTKCATKTCGAPYERVVRRQYFVRETVQTYKPVIYYEPAGTYTTMRAVEKPCNKCGF